MFSALRKESSWNSVQDAVAAVRKRVAGPSHTEKKTVLGGGSNEQRLEALLQNWRDEQYKNVIVMVGAGISVSAGFPDFRDKENGVYARIQQKHGMLKPENLFTGHEYEVNPDPLCIWMQEFLELRRKAVPTITHLFLQLLEEKGCLLRCFTQNIDGLELRAGLPRERVIMAHGNMNNPRCVACGGKYDSDLYESEIIAGKIPICSRAACAKPIRPDIVFFEEPTCIPHDFQKDFDKCDLLIILGTSLNVNPFANLACRVSALCPRLLINRDKVLISNCRHRSRQLRFDGAKAYRDVWLGGQSDESARLLAASLGWNPTLLYNEARLRGGVTRTFTVEASLSNATLAEQCYFGSPKCPPRENSLSPKSQASGSASTTDVISELSSGDRMLEELSPWAIEDYRLSPKCGFSMQQSSSHGSITTMVSELSDADDDEDMDMVFVDSSTGVELISI
jgi:NAD-dependent deacetylase sirtuin 2